MSVRTIYITEPDLNRLVPLVERHKSSRDDLKGLQAELGRAQIVGPKAIPPDAITMRSRARLRDLETGEEMIYTLVYPEEASIEQNKISVLAPIGTAMLGQRAGDEFEWDIPAGKVRLRVEEVMYQPEASGHFHL